MFPLPRLTERGAQHFGRRSVFFPSDPAEVIESWAAAASVTVGSGCVALRQKGTKSVDLLHQKKPPSMKHNALFTKKGNLKGL